MKTLPILFLSLALLLGVVKGQNWTLTLGALLPTPRYHTGAIYDGADFIYTIGGYGNGCPSNSIVKTNVTMLTTIQVAELPSLEFFYKNNPVLLRDDGMVITFMENGLTGRLTLVVFDPENAEIETHELVIPNSVSMHPIISGPVGFATIFDDDGDGSVWQLNLTSFEAEFLEGFYEPLNYYIYAAVWDAEAEVAYIIGKESIFSSTIRRFNFTDQSLDLVARMDMMPASNGIMLAPGRIYVTKQGTSNVGIWEANIETGSTIFHSVEGMREDFDGMRTIYVEKQNRIYFIGGYVGSGSFITNEIRYIDIQ